MLALLALLPAATRWHELEGYTFEKWAAEFGRTYSSVSERAARDKSFTARLADIRAHNADSAQTYKRGVNHMSDRTAEELSQLHGLDRVRLFAERAAIEPPLPLHDSTTPLPQSQDWRRVGAITPVKDQGACGSCWSFASAETLESHWYLKTGQLEELSEQFILDCTPNPKQCGGSGGCGGGTGALAYDRLKELGGIPSEWKYSYLSGNGSAGVCHGLPLPPQIQPAHQGSIGKAANVSGRVSLPTNSLEAMMTAVGLVGPLAISVDAGAWHDYESGVFDGGNHTHPTLDHLVQLVGYGEDADLGAYFLVRNSWTPQWGEGGYIRLKRHTGDDPPCGIDLQPADGDGCKGGPASVKVCGQNGMLYDGVYPLV